MSSPNMPHNDRQRLQRALVFGALLSALGVVLFLGFYIVLGSLESAPRLFLSLCVPPAIIALIMGVYMLTRVRR